MLDFSKVIVRKVSWQDEKEWKEIDDNTTYSDFKKISDEQSGYVVLANSKVVGILKFSRFQGMSFCDLIKIKEEFRGIGLGSKLVSGLEQDLKENNEYFVLTSTQSNEQAQHFWRKQGYVDIGGFTNTDGTFELMLRKTLIG